MLRGATPAAAFFDVEVGSPREPTNAPAIGRLQTVLGSVALTRENVAARAAVGDPVYQGDVIETGVDGCVGIAFADGTKLHLGADTHLVLDQFVCGPDKSAYAAFLRIVKGKFGIVGGEVAAAGRLIIDTPSAQIRGTAPAAGIGSVVFGILTFSLIHELKAAPVDTAVLDDGMIDYNDLKHGIFEIHTKDGKTIVVDDVTKTYVVNLGSASEFANSPTQMAQLHGDYIEAQTLHSQAIEDPFIQQYQHAFAQPQSFGNSGSSTSDAILAGNTQPPPPEPPLSPTTISIKTTSSDTPTTITTFVDAGPAPPPPPTVKPAPALGIESPNVTVGGGSGGEGLPFHLNLGVTLNGGDLYTLVVSNIPVGGTLSDGTVADTFMATAGHTSVNVSGWQFADLTLTAPNDPNFALVVTATAVGPGGVSEPGIGSVPVTVNPLPPTVAPMAGLGNGAGAPILLNLDTGIVINSEAGPNGDKVPNTLYSVTISNIPSGDTLSNSNGDLPPIVNGSVTLDATALANGDLNGLAITPVDGTNFSLTIAAVETDHDSPPDLSAPTIGTEAVTVNPLGPTVDVTQLPIDNLQLDFLSGGLHGVSIPLAGQVLFTYGGATYSTAYVPGSGTVAEPSAVVNGAVTEPFDVPSGLVTINAQGDLVYNENNFQFLSQGETIQYFVNFEVEQGPYVVDEVLPLTIVGGNEPPYIVSASPNPTPILAPASATPNPIVESGTITFADPNWHDTHTVSFAYNSSSTITSLAGSTSLSLTQEQAQQLGVFAVPSTPAQDSYTATLQPSQNVGMADWTFTVDPAAVNALAFGTVVTEVYDVFVTDEWGASTEQQVVVLVDGPPQWIGTVGNWDDTADWSTGSLPRPTDPVDIPSPSAGRAPVEVILTDAQTIADLEIDAGANSQDLRRRLAHGFWR